MLSTTYFSFPVYHESKVHQNPFNILQYSKLKHVYLALAHMLLAESGFKFHQKGTCYIHHSYYAGIRLNLIKHHPDIYFLKSYAYNIVYKLISKNTFKEQNKQTISCPSRSPYLNLSTKVIVKYTKITLIVALLS